ncbi:MAG: hypothetical protein A2V88_12495 [Elusimicrobia bacterium RBG_16_66_12]|nr:MAG: hypothetical protein A2V88_12495 [Elusimicrobia bacterium RBG_16_66_12]
MTTRKFRIAMSPRCFRFKPDALESHAPHKPGVYEFVTFDAERNPKVLFVAVAEKSVYASLEGHLDGAASPSIKDLFGASPDIYFDYVASADISDLSELQDIAGALITKHSPRFNSEPLPSSGRHAAVEVEEVG